MAFHSNPGTDYDPDYLDSKLKMQYLLSVLGESKLIQITNFKNSNRNLFGLMASIICQQYFLNYCLILAVRGI